MITVEQARAIMLSTVTRMDEEFVSLSDAQGSFLAEDSLVSPVSHPLFACSAVDGYAFAFDGRTEWKVVMDLPAGAVSDRPIAPGECARIFTGAMMPMFTDTVVMQEFVAREGDVIKHTDTRLVRAANVRQAGEQIRAGDIVMERGTLYGPAVIGLLAGLGFTTVTAARRPKVAVLVTGDEFAVAASSTTGRIFSSNDVMLEAALRREGIEARVHRCGDDLHSLTAAMKELLGEADMLITTGGVSVGDHDLVKPALLALGAQVHVHGVAQKPGKPLLFATVDGKPVFGLPGNPRAVMILFWEYVLPYLRSMQGARDPGPRTDHLPMSHAVALKGDRAEFRAARVQGGRVTLLADEGSHMLRSLVEADALAYFPATMRNVNTNDLVEVHHLPR